MKCLIVGQGGREHALAWKCAQSKHCEEIWAAPGNAGTAQLNKCKNIAIKATDISALREFAQQTKIDLTIVGPEAPLAEGIIDDFTKHDLDCFGPTKAASTLESSKAFCKEILHKCKVPTANYATYANADAAISAISAISKISETTANQISKQHKLPFVIKADGLASGKGVIIVNTQSEAIAALNHVKKNHPGAIVIEDFLVGEEMSFMALCHGTECLPMASSKDHKRRDNNNQGPNTGGMGAYSPARLCDENMQKRILETVYAPVLQEMVDRGTPYHGFLYAGIMVTTDGTPMVLEFNCRLGDPETQPLMMRLQDDLFDLLWRCRCGHWQPPKQLSWDPRTALGVVLASPGYPEQPKIGDRIHGLPKSSENETTQQMIFHAGTEEDSTEENSTRENGERSIVTAGGRVLCCTALGDDLEQARENAYACAQPIKWPGVFCRTDIGETVGETTGETIGETV